VKCSTGIGSVKRGTKYSKLLTVTLTDARARNLRDLAAAILPERARKYFMFTAAENYSFSEPARIFESIWLTARDGQNLRSRLIPDP
jgi:hypothetical protein